MDERIMEIYLTLKRKYKYSIVQIRTLAALLYNSSFEATGL